MGSLIGAKRKAAAQRILRLFEQYWADYPLHGFPTVKEIERIIAEEISPLSGPGSGTAKAWARQKAESGEIMESEILRGDK